MKHITQCSLLLLPSISLLGACGAQVGEDYKGESMLTIDGSVVVDNPDAPAELQPALAFEHTAYTDDGELVRKRLHIVDATVEGDFPAHFTLDVFEPPPEALLSDQTASFALAGLSGVVGLLGAITAVPPDHPGVIEWPESGSEEDIAALWNEFAGLSEDYRVLYLTEDVKSGSPWTDLIDTGGASLSAGYHLLRVQRPTEAQIAESEACYDEAWPRAVEAYNAEHGTMIDPDVDSATNFFDQPLWDAFIREQASCMIEGYPLVLVSDTAEAPITIHIVPHIDEPFSMVAL